MRFRAGGRGTRVAFELSGAARVRFRVDRVLAGRRGGGRCAAPSRSNRSGASCTRHRTLRGAVDRAGHAGANAWRFRGRLAGRRLGPGRYRLRAVATDAAVRTSATRRIAFGVMRG